MLLLIIVRHAVHRHGALSLGLRGGMHADPGGREGTELEQQEDDAEQRTHGVTVPGQGCEVKRGTPAATAFPRTAAPHCGTTGRPPKHIPYHVYRK